jgi:hypothetical protein
MSPGYKSYITDNFMLNTGILCISCSIEDVGSMISDTQDKESWIQDNENMKILDKKYMLRIKILNT